MTWAFDIGGWGPDDCQREGAGECVCVGGGGECGCA